MARITGKQYVTVDDIDRVRDSFVFETSGTYQLPASGNFLRAGIIRFDITNATNGFLQIDVDSTDVFRVGYQTYPNFVVPVDSNFTLKVNKEGEFVLV